MKQRQTNDNTAACLLLLLLLLSFHVILMMLGHGAGISKRYMDSPKVRPAEVSAFHRITLGIPVSVNTEGQDGLSAVPGIGPKIASSIILERQKRGRFKSLHDLMSVKGIGPAVYKKIGPFLVL